VTAAHTPFNKPPTDNVVHLPTAGPEIPWLGWGEVRSVVDRMWDPENCPHHSIIGLTGSGKSFLAINGILDVCQNDRILIVDTKGDDPIVSSVGRPVREIPRNPWYARMGHRDEPRALWYRLAVHDDPSKAKAQVFDALKRVYREGEWVVYLDEIYDITHPRLPNLGLEPWVTQIYKKGRARHVSIVAGTQSPAWVPRVFYDQASFAWIGRIRDEQRQKRLLEIGGLAKRDLPYVSTLPKRHWLLAADNGDYFARTTVKIGGK
jgi:hypothetical protein